jgi:hypothetical protein
MENYKFRTIDGDDHVVLFTDEQLIKVGKLREQLRVSLYNPLRTKDKLNYGSLVLPYGFSGQFTSIRWQCWPQEGIDCEILFLGSSLWQKGKIRMTANIEISLNKNISQGTIMQENRFMINFDELHSIKLVLEFASENPNFFLPEMPESPLDEIRQQIREQENRKLENDS